MLKHKHTWNPLLDYAIGVFEKQKGQTGSKKKIAVSVERCLKCETLLLKPYPDYKLSDVFAE